MYHGLLALLTRSLRQDARQLRNHFFRLAFVALIYLSMLFAVLTSGMVGAPGLRFFESIAWLNVAFITCAGIGFFATAITEEKEEETLGLLMMAGLNPLGILLGKSTSRLIQASMLLVVQFPFMWLAVTLGGVTPHQIVAAYAALLAFMALLANVALVWSTVCERGGSAAGLTAILLVLHMVLSSFAPGIAAELQRGWLVPTSWYGQAILAVLGWTAESCLYWRLGRIMETGFNESVFSTQVVTNLAGSVFCFGLSWLVFVPSMARTATGGVSRGLVTRSVGRIRIFSPGRAWSVPLAWKDFQFIAGGYSFAVIKLFAYALLSVGLIYFELTWGGGMNWSDVGGLFCWCVGAATAIEACILSARIFHDEVRLQTLSSLLMLPRSVAYLAYSKGLGCLLGLMPSIGCLCLGALLIPGFNLKHAVETIINPMLWAMVLAFLIFLHVVALLSLFVRWGALPLAIVIMAPISSCCPVWQLAFLFVGRGGVGEPMGALVATITIWIMMGLVCFVFQMMIAARLQEIGAKN